MYTHFERRLEHVKRWHHSPQRLQWVALALLEVKTRMCRLIGYLRLSKVKCAIQEATPNRE